MWCLFGTLRGLHTSTIMWSLNFAMKRLGFMNSIGLGIKFFFVILFCLSHLNQTALVAISSLELPKHMLLVSPAHSFPCSLSIPLSFLCCSLAFSVLAYSSSLAFCVFAFYSSLSVTWKWCGGVKINLLNWNMRDLGIQVPFNLHFLWLVMLGGPTEIPTPN